MLVSFWQSPAKKKLKKVLDTLKHSVIIMYNKGSIMNSLPTLNDFHSAMLSFRFVIDSDMYPTNVEYIDDEDEVYITVSDADCAFDITKIVSVDEHNVFVVADTRGEKYTVQFLNAEAVNPFS